MKEFFHSWVFKLFAGIAIFLFALLLRASMVQGFSSVASNLMGVITTPVQKLTAGISDSVGTFLDRSFHANEIYKENQELKEQIRVLTQNQVELEKYRWENETLKKFLEVKEENPDHQYVTASVISRDPNSRFYSFTIDKGTLDGVSYLDPVITADGLVGRVSEVGLTFSKVTTILDPAIDVGGYNTRTRDMGTVSGHIESAGMGLCRMELISRESGCAKDDIIVTAGSTGLFPKDLIVGTVTSISNETDGKSLTALIQPAADIKNVKDVLVITSFRGQGSSSDNLSTPPSEQLPKHEESAAPADGSAPANDPAGGEKDR